MLIAALLVLRTVAIQANASPDGTVPRAQDVGIQMPDHRLPVFQLFFDSGSSEIRREWEEQIDKAVSRFPNTRTRYRIGAHSDTTGSPAGNRRIASLRAAAVAAALRKRGIAEDRISIEVHGEEQLLVPTAEGVREVQNRRVDIMPFP